MNRYSLRVRHALRLCAVVLAGASLTAHGQETSALRTTLGVKVWYHQWQSWFTPSNPGVNVIADTTAAKFALVPTGTVRYKDYFLSAGYFTNTNYEFPRYSEAVGGSLVDTQATAQRKEVDVNLGWYFIPRAAVTVGYKQVRQDFTETTTGGAFSGQSRTMRWLYNAPTIGISGAAPIANRVALYGNAAYGPVTIMMNGAKQSGVKANYSSTEFGLAWAAAQGWTLTLAQKYQIVAQTQSGTFAGLAMRDVTAGWMFGVLYSF